MDAPSKPTAADRKAAITAYHDAKDNAAKAAVVEKYPFLNSIFSPGNHHVPAADDSAPTTSTEPTGPTK